MHPAPQARVVAAGAAGAGRGSGRRRRGSWKAASRSGSR